MNQPIYKVNVNEFDSSKLELTEAISQNKGKHYDIMYTYTIANPDGSTSQIKAPLFIDEFSDPVSFKPVSEAIEKLYEAK